MSLSEETRLTKFSKEDLKSRTDNSEKSISQILETLVSVFNNTLIWVSSMIHLPVFSVWTFTLSSKDQEAELDSEEDANPESEPNIEFPRKMPWNGSEESMMVPSTTDCLYLFKTFVLFNLIQ